MIHAGPDFRDCPTAGIAGSAGVLAGNVLGILAAVAPKPAIWVTFAAIAVPMPARRQRSQVRLSLDMATVGQPLQPGYLSYNTSN
jgi:hypothetical protein